jgi:hypothetical protein
MKTMKRVLARARQLFLPPAVWLVLVTGCSKSAKEAPSSAPVPKPAEAASQLQQAFVSAPPEVKNTAVAASESLRAADYDKAMQSLQTIKTRKDLTPQQFMAVHESEVAMVARLITAMEAGDANAKRAYEAYKKRKGG